MATQTDPYSLENVVPTPASEKPEDALHRPNLLSVPETVAAKRMVEEYDRTTPRVKPLVEQWRINRLRAKGYTGLRLIKVQDEQRAIVPSGATPNMAAMNQAARLKRKMRAQMFADPPIPEAVPATDEDEDRDTAEFATRALMVESGEGKLSYEILAADCFDLASDYASGFLRMYVDPNGGGCQPLKIWASPAAPHKDVALIDPKTGDPYNTEFTLRYVRTNGTLTDDADDPQIVMQWLPSLRAEILSGKHVRLIPDTARDIWDASGVHIAAMVPLGTLKGLFPRLLKLTPEQLQKVVTARPANVKDLLPRGYKDTGGGPSYDDNTLVFTLTQYHKQGAEYQRGCYIVMAGDDVVLHRGEWWDKEHRQPLDLPLTQFKQFNDPDSDNGYGIALMEWLGPGNELRAYLFGFALEHLDRFVRRKTYVPMHSNLQAEQLQAETATIINIVPHGEPIHEQVPDFPSFVDKMWKDVRDDMDSTAGLEQVAQGLNPPGVKSGVHANAIIQQVVLGLADLRQNTERGLVRGWRVMLQLIRAFYSVPQRINWEGEDKARKERNFVGADLGSTRDVRLARGSFTGLSPAAKAELAQHYAELQIFDKEELRHAIAGNVGGLIGLQDEPHRERVKRQIGRFSDGPPKHWQAPHPTIDPRTLQTSTPPDPVLSAIFAPSVADDEPDVARVRMYELGRAMASTKFSRWPKEWQQGMEASYLAARKAAQVVDAKQIAEMRQQLSDAQLKVQAAENKAKVPITPKLADLDDTQTVAVLAQRGIQVPARTIPSAVEAAALNAPAPGAAPAGRPAEPQPASPGVGQPVALPAGQAASAPLASAPGAEQHTLDTMTGMLDEHRREVEQLIGRAVEQLQPPPPPPPIPPAPAPDIHVTSPAIDINLTIVNEDGPKKLKVLSRKGGKIETAMIERADAPDKPVDG